MSGWVTSPTLARRDMLRMLVGAAAATLGACSDGAPNVRYQAGAPRSKTALGSQMYLSDDIGRSMALLSALGASYIRVSATLPFSYLDPLIGAASKAGVRVVLISADAAQPVDVIAYARQAAQIHARYAAANPVWEIWNEPNLAQYWNGPPDVGAYLLVLAATAKALRAAGARDIWTGGTSGVDLNWLYNLATRGAFQSANGCAVHSYKPPGFARTEYIQAVQFLPAGVGLHTTESCISSSVGNQSDYFNQMWYLHRELNLPTFIWCELRDGTAGDSSPSNEPYGLVNADYSLKSVYSAAQLAVKTDN